MEIPHDAPDPTLYELQRFLVNFAAVERNHRLPELERQENDVDHSFSLVTLSWYVYSQVEADHLDLLKIMQYATVHDFLEVYIGDFNAFADAEERAEKAELEEVSLDTIGEDFASFPEMVDRVRGYHHRVDDEARFVATIDKIQAVVLDEMVDWHAHQSINANSEQFSELFWEKHEQAPDEIKPYFAAVIQHALDNYWDSSESSDAELER